MKRRFRRYIVRTEIFSIFHARVEYNSLKNQVIETIGPMRQTTPKSTFPHKPRGIPFRTSMPGPTPLTTPNDNWSVDSLLHSYATKSPLVTMERLKFTPKTAPSLSTITTPSDTPIPRLTPLTIQNGIRFHSAVLSQYTFRKDRPTDRPTHNRQMG